jgi:preprotein translocase subunit SecA
MTEDMPIEHTLISKAIENAQTRVENHNYEIRKYLLEYDNVMNKQRETVYGMRREIMQDGDVRERITDMVEEICEEIIFESCPEKVYPEEWDWAAMKSRLFDTFFVSMDFDNLEMQNLAREDLLEMVKEKILGVYKAKEQEFGEEMGALERYVALSSLDAHWKEHLLALDHLKEGIGLRGYGQKDPLREYQKESFDLFLDMVERVKGDTVRKLFLVQPARSEPVREAPLLIMNRGGDGPAPTKTDRKVGRNDPCPCGSGKKYKKCCGR